MTASTTVGAYRIEEVDVPRLPEAELDAVARFRQAMSREAVPEDPDTPLELVALRMRNRPPALRARDWLVRSDGEVMASAQLARWEVTENPHWRDARVEVRADHRRRGIGKALLREVASAVDDPEAILGSWVSDRMPAGLEFARRVGAEEGLETRESRLDLRGLDRALVDGWARLDPAGYRLVWIDEDAPEELLDNVVAAYDTMNTMPMGTLQFGGWRTTRETVRDWERVRQAQGGERRLMLAIHEATGATAGFTEVSRHPSMAWAVNQLGTAVVPEHRGHGIGKWVKARMVERILADWPESRYVKTDNAYSNAPMLSINDRLGFKVTFSMVAFQVPISTMRRYLEERAV